MKIHSIGEAVSDVHSVSDNDPSSRLTFHSPTANRWLFTFDPVFVNLLTLSLAGNDLKRVVLVDNNPLSFLTNPSNGILVESFFDDPTDNVLQAVWKMIQELDVACKMSDPF